MSLPRLAIRLAAVQALTGRTLAQGRVFDSSANPFDQKLAEQRQPIAIVRTDDTEIDGQGRDINMGQTKCELVIEIAIASRVTIEADDGEGGTTILEPPPTDAGLEIMLDVMEHQVITCLTHDDRAASGWTAALLNFIPRIHRRISRRAAGKEDGVQFAARQIILECETIAPLTPGSAIPDDGAWPVFFELIATVPALAPTGALMRSLLTGQPVEDWRRAAHRLGVPLEVADEMGLGPVLGITETTDNPAEPTEEIVLDDEGTAYSFTEDGVEEV